MKSFAKMAVLLVPLLALTACGERAVINSGEVGKQLTSSGMEDYVRDPGSFRMDGCFLPGSTCPRLVKLETAVSAYTINVDKIFLPKSNVSLDNVTFGIQMRVKQDKAAIDMAFRDIRSEIIPNENQQRLISSEQVFKTYVERKAPEAVIVALREFTVDQALSRPDEVARYARDAVNVALKNTPVEITEFGFPNGVGNPPQVVLDAKNNLYAVEEQKQRTIKTLEAELASQAQRQKVAQTRAVNDKEIAATLGIPVAQYQCLRALDEFADAAGRGTQVFIGSSCVGTAGTAVPVPVQ